MNSLKLAHELGQLIARRKTGETGEFSYVCLRSGEERHGRAEILELVKERNSEGWGIVRKCESEVESDKEFEGKVKKLVSKLPWEKKGEIIAMSVNEVTKKEEQSESPNDKIDNTNVDINISSIKEEVKLKEPVKLQGLKFCESLKEESLMIKQTNNDVAFENMHNQVYKKESLGQKEHCMKQEKDVFQEKMESGSDAEETDPDAGIIASMNYKFSCLSETCDKMFIKWKPCKKHLLQCCGITSTKETSKELMNRSTSKAKKQGAQWRRGGLKKSLLPQMSSRPTEQNIVQAVEQFYASLHNPVNRKHVLGHIRKLYGKGEFRRFGFGTFIEFSKKHGLEVYGFEEAERNSKQITFRILQTLIGKKKSLLGKVNFFCNSCGCNINPNTEQAKKKWKRREASEHIQKLHPNIYKEITQQIALNQGNYRQDIIIEESLKGHFDNAQFIDRGSSLSKDNESAKKDILSRLCEVFYRTENIYHCVLCFNKPIGKAKQEARDHLSTNHIKEELAMKEYIKDKYDQYVNDNFETFLRLVMHKVETF